MAHEPTVDEELEEWGYEAIVKERDRLLEALRNLVADPRSRKAHRAAVEEIARSDRE